MLLNMGVKVEEVASSLVREYLSRKGLKRTIACMDDEYPRTDASINNRSHLRQILHMDDLYKKNKAQDHPLKSMLELLVRHQIDDGHKAEVKSLISDVTQSSSVAQTLLDNPRTEESIPGYVFSKSDMSRSPTEVSCPPHGILSSSAASDTTYPIYTQKSTWDSSLSSESQQDQQPTSSLLDNDSFTKRDLFSDKKTTVTESKNRTSRIRRGMMAGPIASSPQESNRKRQTRRLGVPNPPLGSDEDNRSTRDGPLVTVQQQRISTGLTEKETRRRQETRESQQSSIPQGKEKDGDGYGFERVEKDIHRKSRKIKSMANQSVDDLHMSEMILDDIDDDEELRELSRVSFQPSVPQRSYDNHPMDQHTAIALKELILGSSTSCFSAEWRSQGLMFSDGPDLRYGIVQKKGGPCGVLASIQACVLQKLLFEDTSNAVSLQRLRPLSTTRTKFLALATAEVLWRAGQGRKATVAITSGRNNFIPTGHYRTEGVLEKITCISVDNLKDLQLLLEQHIQQFESGALGCILLTISAVLSRSIERVREDMDVPTTTLIGAHGYCTQELVNLLLCGQAVSNVFDDDMELDSGNGNLTVLKGIKGRCDIGLLSLFEHYNVCKVGVNLKTPKFPIWVVCSESHFSVLFGLQTEMLTDQCPVREFDLYYYDGLANQQEEIRLTVSTDTSAISTGSQNVDADLIPPLELCIRTKWKNAVVDWNDTEPIL